MLIEEINTLYRFNYWAHHRIFGSLKNVPAADYQKNLGSSHGGIHGTLVHVMSAEEIWLKRWKGEPTSGLHKPEEFPTLESVLSYWQTVESSMMMFCNSFADDQKIQKIISYIDLRGNSYSQPLHHMMFHLVNHSSYHRGQIVTMLRQINCTPVGTDMIAFFREEQKSPTT